MENTTSANGAVVKPCTYGQANYSLSLAVACIYVIIGLAAFASNLFIDYVIWRLGLHSLVGHRFILSLSVSDLIQGILVSTVNAAELLTGGAHSRFMRTQKWCRFSAGLSLLAIESTVYNILIISMDRIVAVYYPLQYHRIMSELRAKIIMCSLWVLMLMWSALPSFGWARHNTCLRPAYAICDWGLTLDPTYFLVTGITVVVSVALVCICQVALLSVAFKQMKAMRTESPSRGSKMLSIQKKVTRKVMFIVLTFSVTYLPWFALVIRTLCTGIGGQSYIYACNSLIYANSFLNPWIYAATDQSIRKQVRQCILRGARNKIGPETKQCSGSGDVILMSRISVRQKEDDKESQ